MCTISHVPMVLKRGFNITLHKEGRKLKYYPNDYRTITLYTVILKSFERILLKRIEDSIEKPLNRMQEEFRGHVYHFRGCIMTSVMLKECILCDEKIRVNFGTVTNLLSFIIWITNLNCYR